MSAQSSVPQQPGVVVALPGEARPLARLRSLGEAELAGGGRLMLAGMGARRAEATARRLVASGVDGLISWGTAAALAPGLFPGDLVLAQTVHSADGESFQSDATWREQLRARLAGRVAISDGALAESRELLVDTQSKQRMHEATRAVACDMESAAIAAVAAEHGLPVLVVRVIVDDATMVLPPAARVAVSETGALQPLSLARSLLGRPASMHMQLRSLKHLGVAFRAARMTLGQVAQVLHGRSSG